MGCIREKASQVIWGHITMGFVWSVMEIGVLFKSGEASGGPTLVLKWPPGAFGPFLPEACLGPCQPDSRPPALALASPPSSLNSFAISFPHVSPSSGS